MATKTWKIGEYCQGGIITVETKGNNVTIIGKELDFSQGTRRSSNQSNAKEFTRIELNAEDNDFDRAACSFLMDLTTSYYSDKVMEWIASKVNVNKQLFW